MKNIKVNILNYNGVRSSTTLNYVICEQYYDKRMSEVHDDYLTSIDRRKGIALVAQAFVNDFMDKHIDADTLGVGQYALETAMMHYLIY